MSIDISSLKRLKAGGGQSTPPNISSPPPRLENVRDLRCFYDRLCAEMQGNIRRSGDLRQNILKGLEAGADAQTLFLMAAECIAAMTGDTAFYTQCKRQQKTPDT